jgi:hypothetical protein
MTSNKPISGRLHQESFLIKSIKKEEERKLFDHFRRFHESLKTFLRSLSLIFKKKFVSFNVQRWSQNDSSRGVVNVTTFTFFPFSFLPSSFAPKWISIYKNGSVRKLHFASLDSIKKAKLKICTLHSMVRFDYLLL